MTTIAYRYPFLAADTQATIGGNKSDRSIKVRKRGSILVATTGSHPIAQRFLDWFVSGMHSEEEPNMGDEKDCANGLIFHPDGYLVKFNDKGWEWVRAQYYADGTGWEYATGAMAVGASAEEAVRAAMKHDIYTGGDVTVLRH